jgi:hypothetical protein
VGGVRRWEARGSYELFPWSPQYFLPLESQLPTTEGIISLQVTFSGIDIVLLSPITMVPIGIAVGKREGGSCERKNKDLTIGDLTYFIPVPFLSYCPRPSAQSIC